MPLSSDAGFKQLFAFPELARELLLVAVPQQWTRRTRCNDFEHRSASYTAPTGAQRHDDGVWCIHRAGRPSVNMLLEFQSRPDKAMSTRMLGYAALLLDDLGKQRGSTHGRVPMLLPIVLYSGREPWPYPTSLSAHRPQIPPGLETLQPELNYVLVGRSTKPGVITALLELDQPDDDRTDFPALIRLLAVWLKRQNNASLTRTLANWVRTRLKAQFPEMELPQELTLEEIAMWIEHRFRTIDDMIVYRAAKRWREEGRQEGRQEALLATLETYFKHAGMPVSLAASTAMSQASPELLQQWINTILETGRVPQELVQD